MPSINILNQSDPEKSTDQNSAALINWYMTVNQDQAKYPSAAYPTPGMTLFANINTPVRCLYQEHGVLYAIGGNTFYSINSSGVPTVLGTIGTSSGFAKIQGINNELLITDSVLGYYYIISTNTFNPIPTGQIVQFVNITNVGTGYSATPTVTFSGGGGVIQATGTASVVSGSITAINITFVGSGYTSAPTIIITDSTGINAAATAVMNINSFPANAVDIVTQDEFGLALVPNSQQFYACSISDLSLWPVLSFASASGSENNVVAIATLHRELWIFDSEHIEVWDNLGTANFAFGRNQSIFIEWGCAARQSVSKGNNKLYWLGQSSTGGVVVLTTQNYVPVMISTDGINYQMSTYSKVDDAIGFLYQQEGHEFYVLTFPTAGVTWVYDTNTQAWHQRQSNISGSQTRWLPSCYSRAYNKCLVGDSQTGNIYYLDMTNFTENGTPIQRTMQSHPYYESGVWIYCDRLQVDMDETSPSSGNTLNLYVSRDGGRTFGTAKPNSLAGSGTMLSGPRIYWSRLGQAKTFVFKIQTSMNALCVLLGAWANIRGGSF